MSTRIAKEAPAARKEPRQARSRVTVEAIVQAGTRILSDSGWAGFTTNRVSELAGVSVGSLYQYFPDKLSLLDAIRHRHLDDCLAVMRNASAHGVPAELFAARLVEAIVAAHSVNPGLHRVLLDEAPYFEGDQYPHSAFEMEYLGYYTEAVAAYRTAREGADISGVVLSDAIDGVIHNAARRGTLDDPAIRSELVRLVSLYLAGGAPKARRDLSDPPSAL
jgi:AcrR family transcriptional regulator